MTTPALIDTHAHFALGESADGYAAVCTRAFASGVASIMAIGGTLELNAAALAAARDFPGRVKAAVGCDRDQAADLTRSPDTLAGAMRALEVLLREHPDAVGAIGETGLDYHYSPDTTAAQRALFAAQLSLARRHGRAVVVHSREADDDTVKLLREETRGPRPVVAVLHCFTGSLAFAERLLETGVHISFSGILTFRNADSLREVASRIPDERLLIETDAPFLAPVPVRGQRNEPAHVRHVAERLAQVRGVSVAEIARITTANARRVFGLAW